MQKTTSLLKGYYRDLLSGPNGEILFDSGWHHNTIVESCRVLLTRFMKFDHDGALPPSNGIQSLAVGSGLEAWDDTLPPVDETVTDLENRYTSAILLTDLTLEYLDASDNPSVTATNRLQITATLPPGYPAPIAPLSTYPLREFGLFGSFDETEYMINCVRHPVIHKDVASTLVRAIRLIF